MIVSIFLDAFIVFAAIIGIVIGLRQGFVKMFVLRFRKIAAAVISLFLAKPLGAVIAKYFLTDKLAGWIMSLANITDAPAESPEKLLETVPLLLRWFAEQVNYDLAGLADRAYANGQGMQRALITELSYPLASLISVIIAWVILCIILYFAIKILSGLIENVFELPVLKQVNAFCGAFVALVLNFTILWLVCQLLEWALTADMLNNLAFMKDFSMEQTYIAKYLCEFNPLAFILSAKPK